MTLASTRPISILQGQDFYVPAFEVKVGEKPMARDVVNDIIQVSYKDSLAEVDSFDITINNWDADKRQFKYVDSQLFDPGQKVELWMGYFGKDNLRLMLKGYITSLKPDFPAGGQPTLVIGGLNLMHILRKKQETHAYRNATDHDIARKIQGRLGFPIELVADAAGASHKYDYILQDNQYDILFLMDRARYIGYDLFVIEEGEKGDSGQSRLYFGPSDKVKRVSYELEYGRTLIDFHPTLNIAQQVLKVTVQAWDPVNKKRIEVSVDRDQLDVKGLNCSDRQGAINRYLDKHEETISNKPVANETEARTLAKETLEKIVKNMVTANGSVVGLPDLRTGSALQIRGLGECFSGRYFVTGTTHTIGDSGYTTQFECRLEEPK
jgi:phage protein D